ncbi:hypothetical protein, partial [Nocardia asiatica]|uniref:hypothetical protein n=1 Tax=Nocardia asiatica TaxID=209252 RepID=UPI001C3F383F
DPHPDATEARADDGHCAGHRVQHPSSSTLNPWSTFSYPNLFVGWTASDGKIIGAGSVGRRRTKRAEPHLRNAYDMINGT